MIINCVHTQFLAKFSNEINKMRTLHKNFNCRLICRNLFIMAAAVSERSSLNSNSSAPKSMLQKRQSQSMREFTTTRSSRRLTHV